MRIQMMRQQTSSKGRENKKGEKLVQNKIMKCVYFTRVLESKEKNMTTLAVHFKKLLEREIQPIFNTESSI